MKNKNPQRRCRVSKWQCPGGLQYDVFEPRMLLAGNVSVSLELGRLLVVGDSLANQVQIIGTANGHAVVTGLDGTTINGGTAAFSVSQQLRDVDLRMNEGDDQVRMHGLVLSSDLMLQGNAGNDSFEVSHSLVRNFSANMGAGNDVLQLDNLYALFSSSTLMEQGNDIVSINAHAAGVHISISTGDGDDVLTVNDMGMRKQLQVDTGNGNDQVLLAGETYAGRNSGFRLGSGNDFLAILPGQTEQHSRLQKNLTIDGGADNDQVVFDARVTVGKRSLIDGNAGTDGLDRGGAAFNNPGVQGFESDQVPGLATTLDGMFDKLQDADIDPSIFGGPDLVRELGITASSTSQQFTENGAAVNVDDGLVVVGPSDAAITSATIAIGAFSAGNDLLQFTNTSDITGTFNTTTGIMTLVGTGNLAAWQTALRSVRFSNTSEAPDTTSRTMTFTVNTATESATASRTVTVVSVSDNPVLDGVTAARDFDIDDDSLVRPLPVSPGLTLTDSDTTQFDLANVSVAIGSGRITGDFLTFTPETGVAGNYSDSTGVLSFSGTVSIETLERLLKSVAFDNTESRARQGTRAITISVGDGVGTAIRNVSINVVATDSVTISTTASTLNYTGTDAATVVDPGVTVTPGTVAGSENAISASVRFDSGYITGQDVLQFDPVTGITGSFDSTTGILRFTGTATIAVYQALLRSVRYINTATGSTLVTGNRIIEFGVVSNGVSAAASRTVTVSAASQERLIQNYLTANSLTSQRTDSGLHVIVEQTGNGRFPVLANNVRVNYRGFLLDGTNFESNNNVTFPLGGVIDGWQEGIPFFSEGGGGQLIIPSALAYGSAGSPPNIPADAILRFEIDLLAAIDTNPPILGVSITDHSEAGFHEHATLRILIDGVAVPLEADIGVNDGQLPGLRGIHTHDSSGTLHIETPTEMDAPLGAFFQIWGRTFNSGRIFNNVANDDKEVVMLVNGVRNLEYETYNIQDGDVIEIQYRDRT